MSFFAKLLGTAPDPKEELRPLWLWVVGEARNPEWYRQCGAVDSVDGRFDMITNILAVAMLRLEQDEHLVPASARLTELFVDDMEGQLRELGFGDPTLGKKMGEMMEAMGGRLGAFRTAFPSGHAATTQAVNRNANLADGSDGQAMASKLIALSQRLGAVPDDLLLSGAIGA